MRAGRRNLRRPWTVVGVAALIFFAVSVFGRYGKAFSEGSTIYKSTGGRKRRPRKQKVVAGLRTPRPFDLSACSTWTDSFKDTFQHKCGFLEPYLRDYLAAAKAKAYPPVVYSCLHNGCGGIGDRMSGILGVFSHAIQHERPFKLDFGLDDFPAEFESCVLPYSTTNDVPKHSDSEVSLEVQRGELVNRFAQKSQTLKVKQVYHRHADSWCYAFKSRAKGAYDSSRPAVLEMNRACTPPGLCEERQKRSALDDSFRKFGPSQVYGCLLNVAVSSTKRYLENTVPVEEWNVETNAQETKEFSMGELKSYLDDFFVIGIHVRVGDEASFGGLKMRFVGHENFFMPFHCATLLENYFEWSGRTGGKKVKWLFFSDSLVFKTHVWSRFGPRESLLMINRVPTHVDPLFNKGTREHLQKDVKDTLEEWYVLSLADVLVSHLTEYGSRATTLATQGLQELYAMGSESARISAFSKTSHVWALGDHFYDARTCVKRVLPYDGNWRLTPPTCADSARYPYKGFAAEASSQPHLSYWAEVMAASAPNPLARTWKPRYYFLRNAGRKGFPAEPSWAKVRPPTRAERDVGAGSDADVEEYEYHAGDDAPDPPPKTASDADAAAEAARARRIAAREARKRKRAERRGDA